MQQAENTQVHASGVHGDHPPNVVMKTSNPFHQCIKHVEEDLRWEWWRWLVCYQLDVAVTPWP